jgi:hypothetical protein
VRASWQPALASWASDRAENADGPCGGSRSRPPAALVNQFDPNIIELPKGATAGALLTQALWDTARVRKGNREQFAITTNRDGSLTMSRAMALALERENDGLRVRYHSSRQELASYMRSAVAPVYDFRKPIEKVRDSIIDRLARAA